MKKLVILGGTSPFTAAFFDALARSDVPPMEVIICGRNQDLGQLVTAYAQRQLRLPWTIAWTCDLAEALDGSDFVLNQIRFGGLELREQGEKLCTKHSVPADETLGPAALLTALFIRQDIFDLCRQIKQYCPEAWVLQMINPLSSITAIMAEHLKNVVGLCELPQFTFEEASSFVSVGPLEWDYIGLNHRGFIHHLQHEDRNLIEEMPYLLGNQKIGGIEAETIADLKAIPLKYFKLFTQAHRSNPSRATALQKLRNDIIGELENDPSTSPPSLSQRYTEWYPKSVVPFLAAIQSSEPSEHIVNVFQNGLVRELKAYVSQKGIDVLPIKPAHPEITPWLSVFEEHEFRFQFALKNPSQIAMEDALFADPTVPKEKVVAIKKSIFEIQSKVELCL